MDAKERPLPFITVKNNARETAFPDPATLWAWAHVHVNRGLTASDAEIVADGSRRGRRAAPGDARPRTPTSRTRASSVRAGWSRTRRTAHSSLPAFESGRLAGLGLDPSQAPSATASAWSSNGADADSFPVYFRWRFRTGTIGDFEYLVRLLEPKPVDKRVGRPRPGRAATGHGAGHHRSQPCTARCRSAGPCAYRAAASPPTELAEVERRENWAAAVSARVSARSRGAHQSGRRIHRTGRRRRPTPPPACPASRAMRTRDHAAALRALARADAAPSQRSDGTPVPNPDNWVHELNLDPLFRVPAGFGTRVVQSKQEELMAAAWEQVGDVLEANQRMRRLQVRAAGRFRLARAEFAAARSRAIRRKRSR